VSPSNILLALYLTICRAEPEVKDWVQVLTQRYAGMKIVVGRDKLDEVQVCRTLPFTEQY
jgi:trehalose-6-phosphate synthase